MTKISSPLDTFSQFALPALTIGAQVVLAMKHPEWSLILIMLSQPFWFYSSWKSYKQAGQIGIFITTVIYSIVTAIGIANYWFL